MWSKRLRLGVVVSPNVLSLSFCTGFGRRIQHEEIACEIDVSKQSMDGLMAPLCELVARLPTQVKRADTLVNVALPDPLFRHSTLQFDDFPRGKTEAMELVKWRHCRDLELVADETSIGYERYNFGSSFQTTVLAQSLSKSVVDAVKKKFWQSSLVPSRIDAVMSSLSNSQPKKKAARALFFYSDSWWTFQIVGSGGVKEMQFSAWGNLEQNTDNIVRRLRRIITIASKNEQTKPTQFEIYRRGKDQREAVDALVQNLPIEITETRISSWSAMADRVSEVRK